MMPLTIVVDIWSVVPDLRKSGSKYTGTPVPGLVPWVKACQEQGSTIFFCAGEAHDPYIRQLLERYLESIGVRSVFVTHGIPDGFHWFVSKRAWPFNGENFPLE
jgi:hypothetical protein